ncbi:MAG TPA: vitamin K epoxide reductase family protein [Flavipsychrobacter sp.]|nr:vitamin K epoxide reductase family protein [Flavipsychrobacter sp.]
MSDPAHIPPAWDYNPSSWRERIPLVIIASIGFFIAIYLALYQLKVVDSVWDPFFGDGTERVLTSKVSQAFPIPDALLGAFGYLVDVVSGIVGGVNRWKTMPWIVIIFGVAVGPLGLVSILLVISQPVFVGAWCTLCLTSAVISVMMISPAMDEFLASLQYLQRVRRRGLSTWQAFWGVSSIVHKMEQHGGNNH